MARYPGQQPRRWPLVIVGGAVVMLAGLGTGWALSGRASGSPTTPSAVACPGGRDDAGRRTAAVCLVTSYFALENSSLGERNAKLADLAVPSALDSARTSYKALDAKVATEYAAVAATNLTARGASAASGQAWVAFVDSYRDGSAPLAQWWITTFELRWQDGRWWLDGGVATQVDATPQTAGTAPRSGFGPGWVAAGAG